MSQWVRQRFPFADARTVFSYVEEHSTDEEFRPKAPSNATKSMPGSQDKIAILAARVERGEELWHRRDNTLEDVIQKLAEAAGILGEDDGD